MSWSEALNLNGMVRNIVIFSDPARLGYVQTLDLDVIEPFFNGRAMDCGLAHDCKLFMLQDRNAEHVAVLLNCNLEGELRFVYHSRTFPVPDPGNPPRVDHVALEGFVKKVRTQFPGLVVRAGKQGKHLRDDLLAYPYEKVSAILTNVNGNRNQAYFNAGWEWLKPPDARVELFTRALAIHSVAISLAGGEHPTEVTGRTEIEALEGWNRLLSEERPPMDGGDESFKEFILRVINQSG